MRNLKLYRVPNKEVREREGLGGGTKGEVEVRRERWSLEEGVRRVD